jgi:hypothetical protein
VSPYRPHERWLSRQRCDASATRRMQLKKSYIRVGLYFRGRLAKRPRSIEGRAKNRDRTAALPGGASGGSAFAFFRRDLVAFSPALRGGRTRSGFSVMQQRHHRVTTKLEHGRAQGSAANRRKKFLERPRRNHPHFDRCTRRQSTRPGTDRCEQRVVKIPGNQSIDDRRRILTTAD